MRETSTAEVVSDVDGLASRVAEYEAKEQRTLTRWQSVGAPDENVAQFVGGSHPRRTGGAGADLVHHKNADNMARREPSGTGRRPLQTADNEDALARLRNPQRLNACAGAGDGLDMTTIVEAHIGANA
jgi:hypothetical protein